MNGNLDVGFRETAEGGRLLDGALFKLDQAYRLLLLRGQAIQKVEQVTPRIGRFEGAVGFSCHAFIELFMRAKSAASHKVDQAIARDREHPGAQRIARIVAAAASVQ